jgi:hypothetical protein
MEFNLDLKGYYKLVELHERNNQTTSKDNWFVTSESVFKNHVVNTKDDFIKLIAFAYSWMPTIPKLLGDIDWNIVHPKLIQLQNGDLTERNDLLSMIVPYINNSEVGTSKVLHFIAPNHVPIIDSRVLNTWFVLFEKSYKLKRTTNDVKEKIVRYINYWDYLNIWINNINGIATIRELEGMLYGINGNVS